MTAKSNYTPPKFVEEQIVSAHGHLNQLADAVRYGIAAHYNWRPGFYARQWRATTPETVQFYMGRENNNWMVTHRYAYRHKDPYNRGLGRFAFQYIAEGVSAGRKLNVRLYFSRHNRNSSGPGVFDELKTFSVSSPTQSGQFTSTLPELSLEHNDIITVDVWCQEETSEGTGNDPGPIKFIPKFVGEIDKSGEPNWPSLPPFTPGTTPDADDWQALSTTAELVIERSVSINPGFVGFRINNVQTWLTYSRSIFFTNRNSNLRSDWTLGDTVQEDQFGCYYRHSGAFLDSRGNDKIEDYGDDNGNFVDGRVATSIKVGPLVPSLPGGDPERGLWKNGQIVRLGSGGASGVEHCKLGTYSATAPFPGGTPGGFVGCERGFNNTQAVDLEGEGEKVIAHVNDENFGKIPWHLVDNAQTQRVIFDTPLAGLGLNTDDQYEIEAYTVLEQSGDDPNGTIYFHGVYELPDEEPGSPAWVDMDEWEYLDDITAIKAIRDNLFLLSQNTEHRNQAALFYDTADEKDNMTGGGWTGEHSLPRYFVRDGRWLHYFNDAANVKFDFSGDIIFTNNGRNPAIRYVDGNGDTREVTLSNESGWNIYDLDQAEGLFIGEVFWLIDSTFGFLDIDA